jgi:hypothetical protein
MSLTTLLQFNFATVHLLVHGYLLPDPFQFIIELINFFNSPNPSGRTEPLGLLSL